MKISGIGQRIEFKPDNDDEKALLQEALDRQHEHGVLLFWGDSDAFSGGAFVVSTAAKPAAQPKAEQPSTVPVA